MKRRHHEEHINHERWAIPYGDLITLLLALFVVMYAVSAVNETKFRVMAQSINEAFNGTGKVIEPIRDATPAAQVPLPNQSRSPTAAPIAKIDVPIPPRNLPLPGHEGAAAERQDAANVNTATAANTTVGKTENASLSQISDEVKRAMKPLIDKSLVSVRQTPDWLEIEVRTDILFPVGVAKLQPAAEDVLRKLAGILAPFPNAMRIEGYTDNTPIATALFPSNWELSAARAATVARLITTTGVDPHRVGIIGWGEFRPTANNASEEGRNRNRRVLIVVMSDKAAPARFYSDADRVDLAGATPSTTPPPAATAATEVEAPTAGAARLAAPDGGTR
ncbi:chemotaxis protein MotB [Luteibacter sp. UNC138MFCol5.1]|uniref:flagellar motor protein MotD n=1 Tax=Luteibacter sp. UNC138MFCol5.1 TaxID=1502774 RepID=UPI0008ABF0B8|nr:flagellar motor protein MotD [Luteibacter sp. UNC138MFCol5.1]SEO66308.1 chemotaxis protein MotB [Luteibacter sp. UNC138MFCol5.1]